jgi:hypothetical protein
MWAFIGEAKCADKLRQADVYEMATGVIVDE